MNRLTRLGLACCFALTLLVSVPQSASADASVQAWNCREVIANTVGFFRTPTGHDTVYPDILYRGYRFRSHGVDSGRYLAQTWGPYHYNFWGYVTTDSRWVLHVPDYYCY